MRRVFLIGYMCSGKSTLARALSGLPGVTSVDTDRLIEQRAGMPIADIFATQGEDAFRRIEREVLAEICATQSQPADVVVVACGGGLPCQPGAMQQMRQSGLTVWLRPSSERLIDRLMEGRDKRPLLSAIASREEMEAFAERMQASRAPFYSQAETVFDSSLLETQSEIDATARRFAAQFLDN